VVKKKDIPFVATSSSLSTEFVEKYKESEAQMHSSDKLVFETEVRCSSTPPTSIDIN
jgi:heat shock protein 4